MALSNVLNLCNITETHDGVQDMACDTFIKISLKCRRHFIQVQVGEMMPFIEEILNSISSIICDLNQQQVNYMYSLIIIPFILHILLIFIVFLLLDISILFYISHIPYTMKLLFSSYFIDLSILILRNLFIFIFTVVFIFIQFFFQYIDHQFLMS